MENQLTANQMVGNLIRVGHKDLSGYAKDGYKLLNHDELLMAHMIAWNFKNGEVRDSKVALPAIALRGSQAYHQNAVAHLLLLDPRNLVRACHFYRDNTLKKSNGGSSLLRAGVSLYLKARENKTGWWDKTALQHRASMKTLYAMNHLKPSKRAQDILFKRKYPANSVFEALKNIGKMNPREAAGTILNYRIPFTIAIGASGGIKGNTDLMLALVENMSGAELITNTKMLEKMGALRNPAIKSAYEEGIKKAKGDKKVSSLKAKKAMEVVSDKSAKAKLGVLQEEKIDNLRMDGDWLILGDKSGSMTEAINKAKEVAAFIAKVVGGKAYLVFFDVSPRLYNVSGMTLPQIESLTAGIFANGGTSIGCGLQMIMDKGIAVNGIVICSDGGENNYPYFSDVYKKYEEKMGITPNVYLLHVHGDSDVLSRSMKEYSYEKIEASDLDYYGLPNLAKILKSNRYSLIDEIMQVPLLTIADALQMGGKNEN